MLKGLYIRNYILIEELDIEFEKGLNSITGETGAGKSILLGALGLMLGNRSDSSVLLDKTHKCIVEGRFEMDGLELHDFFEANDLDYDPLCLIRREIAISGKSRAFINDTPVNLQVLKTLSQQLVDIHSQHQNLLLGNNRFQLGILDQHAGINKQLSKYKTLYHQWIEIKKELVNLQNQADKQKAEIDYLEFQHNQLSEARLNDPDEQVELETELLKLKHAEEIKTSLEQACQILDNEEINVNSQLSDLNHLLRNVMNYLPGSKDWTQRVESVQIELSDLRNELSRQKDSIEFSPMRQQETEERLNIFYELEQKHRVHSLPDLIALRDQLKEQLQSIENTDETLAQKKKQSDQYFSKLSSLANEISQKRRASIPSIESEILKLLKKLGMPQAMFRVQLSQKNLPDENGFDQIDFLFSANKNLPLDKLSKVASGGETSRIMLCLKSLIGKSKAIPTIIFDEVDSGISGEIALQVGSLLKSLARNLQVLNITHLPQVAAKGDTHFVVYKQTDKNGAQTLIRKLTADEVLVEIAQMISGNEAGPEALENARSLLKQEN